MKRCVAELERLVKAVPVQVAWNVPSVQDAVAVVNETLDHGEVSRMKRVHDDKQYLYRGEELVGVYDSEDMKVIKLVYGSEGLICFVF